MSLGIVLELGKYVMGRRKEVIVFMDTGFEIAIDGNSYCIAESIYIRFDRD